MGVFETTALIVGTVLGAGFLSGAELMRFLGGRIFLPAVILSSLCFFLFSALFLRLGKKYGGFSGALSRFPCGDFLRRALAFLSFVPAAGMLAGLDELFSKISPFGSILGLLLVLLFLRRGMKGIGILNLVLVPILMGFVFFSLRGGVSLILEGLSCSLAMGPLYAGMNVLLAIPVLMDAGKSAKRPTLSALLSSILIALTAFAVLGVIYRKGLSSAHAPLPFLSAIGKNFVFTLASALAILTSLASSLYSLFRLAEKFEGKKRTAAKAGMLFAAGLLSRMGLSGIVTYFYPVMGILGVLFSAFCVLYEYLFEKDHEKIHRGGKQAQDDGRA